jgi:hypothetical protein
MQVWACVAGLVNQKFSYDLDSGRIEHGGLCFSANKDGVKTHRETCDSASVAQQWTFEEQTLVVLADPFAEQRAQEKCNSAWSHPHLGQCSLPPASMSVERDCCLSSLAQKYRTPHPQNHLTRPLALLDVY